MSKRFLGLVLLVVSFSLLGEAPARADNYAVDGMHASVYFKIKHLDLSWVFGRFNQFTGSCVIDPSDPTKCSFEMNIKAESIDTANAARDKHLRSPDFFNVAQYPAITFKSTSVRAIQGGYEVTGDLTMHGVTKPVTFSLMGGKTAEFPKGMVRTGFSTDLMIKRSDFGIGEKIGPALGEDVHAAISFEAVKK
jgi:polyisoprenoid-binding protein YceI